MITRNQIELTARYYGSKVIVTVYRGARLIWEAISSCFGSGCWLGDRVWKGDDVWRGF